MECRVLQKRKCEITQYYNNNHAALDLVGENYTLDNIIAHSEGKIVELQDGLSNIKGSVGKLAYGNYIKIEHIDGYQTLYAHMKNGLNHRIGEYVKEGDILGNMGDSGNAYGAHLHFEIWKDNKRINPLEYLNKKLPSKQIDTKLKYKIGDVVEIKGVYISSTSTERLRPLINVGEITKVLEDRNNPYLLDDGRIGWVNDNVIINKLTSEKYLSNTTYKGNSLVDALKEINVDSSYKYREELAKINNINNYRGTAEQNTKMLNLLKQGILKY